MLIAVPTLQDIFMTRKEPGMASDESTMSLETKILDYSEVSFAENGYANTKMLAIAEAAGVNHALIHYYFRSKKNLYEKVVERLFDTWEQELRIFDWGKEDPEETIREYIQGYFWFHVKSTNFQKIRMWDKIEKTNVFQSYIEKYWLQDLNNKRAAIDTWQKQGKISKHLNAGFLMHSIWSAINYFYLFSAEEFNKMFCNEENLEENRQILIDQISNIFINGIFK